MIKAQSILFVDNIIMTSVVTVIWFILWISDQAISNRVLVEKRRSVLPGDQREKFSTSGLNNLVVGFSACQGNRPYMSLYFCSWSKVKLKVTLGRESTILWNCNSDSSSNDCTKMADHQPVQIDCNSDAPVWISWRISGKIQFGTGTEVGKKLYFDASVANTSCSSGVTEWDWGTEIEGDTVQMTLHQSEGENRCYLTGPERVGRVTCGDEYTNEVWCLSCGCCYDRLSTDQMACFYSQVNKQTKKSCERTFEEVLGAVEFKSIQNPDSNVSEPISFLVLLKQTIKTVGVGLNFGDGTPPLDGIRLDRSTPIPGCSSDCNYYDDWFRTVVTHFYADAGDFEAILTVTDSSRGVIPFVMRKTSVKVDQRFETVFSLVSETDETAFLLPSFNPVVQREFRCNRFETRILLKDDSGSGNTTVTVERWNGNQKYNGWNDSLVLEGSNGSVAFKEQNETLTLEGSNYSSVSFTGKNETLTFEEPNQANAVERSNCSKAFEGSIDSLPSNECNGSLTFESARNITFMAAIESDCIVPGVSINYVMSWSLRRRLAASDGNYHHDDGSLKLVSSATRFNIPPHSLSKGSYEVQLEVRMFDAFRSPINISKAVTSFDVIPSKEEDVSNYYFLNGTVSLTNNISGPGFSHQWLCTRKAIRDVYEIEAPPIDDQHPFGNCMKDTASAKSLIPSARNQLFPASLLHFSSLPASYYFHCIARSSSSSSNHSVASDILSTSVTVVVLLPGRPPVVSIKCITGCSRPHARSYPIWLEGACVNCPSSAEQLSYVWTFNYALQSNAYLRSLNWADDSVTGDRLSYVIVYPDKFMRSLAQDEFAFTLTVSQADMTSSEASYHFPKERSEYDELQNLFANAFLRIKTNSSSCKHLNNMFLVTAVTYLSFSCQL